MLLPRSRALNADACSTMELCLNSIPQYHNIDINVVGANCHWQEIVLTSKKKLQSIVGSEGIARVPSESYDQPFIADQTLSVHALSAGGSAHVTQY